MAESHINFSLLENGLDFILSSVKLTVEPQSQSDFKYAMLHLSAGVELVLKERLKVEDWKYIFEKPNKATEELLKSGEFRSVGLDTSIKRLTEDFGVDISESDREMIKDLKRRRNKVEHFEFRETEAALKSISAKVLNFVFQFVNTELEDSLTTKELQEQMAAIRLNLVKFEDFIKVRQEELKPRLKEVEADFEVLLCPLCYQRYLVLEITKGDELECMFCLNKDNSQSIAFNYSTNILGYSYYLAVTEGDEYPTLTCPSCGIESFVRTDESFICFQCCERSSFDSVDECGLCGQKYFVGEDDFGICKGCWNYKMSRDD